MEESKDIPVIEDIVCTGDWVTVMNISSNDLFEFSIGENYNQVLEETCLGKEKGEKFTLFGEVYTIDYITKRSNILNCKNEIINEMNTECKKNSEDEIVEWYVKKILRQFYCVSLTHEYVDKLFYVGRLAYQICMYRFIFEKKSISIEKIKLIKKNLNEQLVLSLVLNEIMKQPDIEQLQGFENKVCVQFQIIGYLYEKLGFEKIYELFDVKALDIYLEQQINLSDIDIALDMKGIDFLLGEEQSYIEKMNKTSIQSKAMVVIQESMRIIGKNKLALLLIEKSNKPSLFLHVSKNNIKISSSKYKTEKSYGNIVRMKILQDILNEIQQYKDKNESGFSGDEFLEKLGCYCIWAGHYKEMLIDNVVHQLLEEKIKEVEANKIDRKYYHSMEVMLGLEINMRNNILGQGSIYEIKARKSKLDFYCYNVITEKPLDKVGEPHIIYQFFMKPLEQLFSGEEVGIPTRILQIFIDCIQDSDTRQLVQYVGHIELFDFRKVAIIGIDKYIQIINNIERILDDTKRFVVLKSKLIELNGRWLFVYNEIIYAYQNIFLNSDMYEPIDDLNEESTLDFIVNPTDDIIKKIIRGNYRKVLDYENESIQKYAASINNNARNLLGKLNGTRENEILDYKESIYEEDVPFSIETEITQSSPEIYIFNSNNDVSKQICGLFDEIEIENIFLASGYVFQSGMNLLSHIFDIARDKKIKIDLLVGSLQKYNTCKATNSILLGMDKLTAKVLNSMIEGEIVNLYTIEKRFYHGKIYYFSGKEKSAAIIGSSNISHSAYKSNHELNIAFVLKNDDIVLKDIKDWIAKTSLDSTQILTLDEVVFADKEIKVDITDTIELVNDIQKKIDSLEDEELKYRLNLWMSYKPRDVLQGLNIDSLPDYIAFVFEEYKMIVLESFEAGNSYFCLKYTGEYQSKLKQIAGLSKTEIYNISNMEKRGYHISNKLLLEQTVRGYFTL